MTEPPADHDTRRVLRSGDHPPIVAGGALGRHDNGRANAPASTPERLPNRPDKEVALTTLHNGGDSNRDRVALTESFAMVPEWLLDAGVSDRAIVVFARLKRYADRDGRAWPRRRTLADVVRCSPASVDRAIVELVDVGALRVFSTQREDGGRGSNLYDVWPFPIVVTGAQTSMHLGGDPSSPVTRAPSSPVRSVINESQLEREPLNERGKPCVPSSPTKRRDDTPAEAIVRSFYEESTPKPAQPWVAMVGVVNKMLKAGHSETDVAWAIREAPVVSTGSLTLTLNTRNGRTGRPRDNLDGVREALADVGSVGIL